MTEENPDGWGSIPIREITVEELVERYPRTRAEVDAALQVPPSPEVAVEWDQTFRSVDSGRYSSTLAEAQPPRFFKTDGAKGPGPDYAEEYELRPTTYNNAFPATRMSGKSEALRLVEELRDNPPELTQEQVEAIQRDNARQVRDEWIAAGRPGVKHALQFKEPGEDWTWVTGHGLWIWEYPSREAAEGAARDWQCEWRAVPWYEVPEADRRRYNLRPLRVRFELAPGFGLSWLSLLACCCELRGDIIDLEGCGLDAA
jgi:hypothetical protein